MIFLCVLACCASSQDAETVSWIGDFEVSRKDKLNSEALDCAFPLHPMVEPRLKRRELRCSLARMVLQYMIAAESVRHPAACWRVIGPLSVTMLGQDR